MPLAGPYQREAPLQVQDSLDLEPSATRASDGKTLCDAVFTCIGPQSCRLSRLSERSVKLALDSFREVTSSSSACCASCASWLAHPHASGAQAAEAPAGRQLVW